MLSRAGGPRSRGHPTADAHWCAYAVRTKVLSVSKDDVGGEAELTDQPAFMTLFGRKPELVRKLTFEHRLRDPGVRFRVGRETDPPTETTHWTADLMARASGISACPVRRIWKAHGLQPHRCRQFKLSNDPNFVAKLRVVVGLYVDPPAHAIVRRSTRRARSRPSIAPSQASSPVAESFSHLLINGGRTRSSSAS
jgi:hypothetical protein